MWKFCNLMLRNISVFYLIKMKITIEMCNTNSALKYMRCSFICASMQINFWTPCGWACQTAARYLFKCFLHGKISWDDKKHIVSRVCNACAAPNLMENCIFVNTIHLLWFEHGCRWIVLNTNSVCVCVCYMLARNVL